MQTADWHQRYQEQAQWTKPLRHYILDKLPIRSDWLSSELGCGTGAILQDLSSRFSKIIGLDRNLEVLTSQGETKTCLLNADAYQPPFQANTFDFLFCHYFLLWMADPLAVLMAARCLLKPGGYLAVLAEPDYASRQTLPVQMSKLAKLQNRSLAAQGVNLKVGRQLGQLLTNSGFSIIEYGSIKETDLGSHPLTESEKNVLRADWRFLDKKQESEITQEELEELLKAEPERWYVPTYYALAELNE